MRNFSLSFRQTLWLVTVWYPTSLLIAFYHFWNLWNRNPMANDWVGVLSFVVMGPAWVVQIRMIQRAKRWVRGMSKWRYFGLELLGLVPWAATLICPVRIVAEMWFLYFVLADVAMISSAIWDKE